MRFPLRRPQLMTLLAIAAAVISLTLTGCSSTPKPAPPATPTVLAAALSANANVNPDARGRPSPVTVRVYGLKTRAAFDTADFFSLYDKDKQTLGGDLVDKEEFQLMPGENRPLGKQLASDIVYLGVFAAFRDLERAQWRAVVRVVPGQISVFDIRLEKSTVTIVKKE
jgi:type VI secretion system protein VasD